MPVTEIFVLRHGHRLAWSLDPTTGRYTSSHPFPTGLPADPPLASHGVRQAEETADYLSTLLREACLQDRLRIYSSLFYRCLETLRPLVKRLQADLDSDAQPHSLKRVVVRGERGIGEWFGRAWFEQPTPAQVPFLRKRFFPWIDEHYESRTIPNKYGERIEELHNRVSRALSRIIRDVEAEYTAAGRQDEKVILLICGHAAQIIASGRVLTGRKPDDLDEEDFQCFTCGISKFIRRYPCSNDGSDSDEDAKNWSSKGGVTGGWDCSWNSYCGHLSQGEERGWHFHGDESFDSYNSPSTRPITSDGSANPRKTVKKTFNNTSSTFKL